MAALRSCSRLSHLNLGVHLQVSTFILVFWTPAVALEIFQQSSKWLCSAHYALSILQQNCIMQWLLCFATGAQGLDAHVSNLYYHISVSWSKGREYYNTFSSFVCRVICCVKQRTLWWRQRSGTFSSMRRYLTAWAFMLWCQNSSR